MKRRKTYDEDHEESKENVITIGNLTIASHDSDLTKVAKTVKELIKNKEVRDFLKKHKQIPQIYMG